MHTLAWQARCMDTFQCGLNQKFAKRPPLAFGSLRNRRSPNKSGPVSLFTPIRDQNVPKAPRPDAPHQGNSKTFTTASSSKAQNATAKCSDKVEKEFRRCHGPSLPSRLVASPRLGRLGRNPFPVNLGLILTDTHGSAETTGVLRAASDSRHQGGRVVYTPAPRRSKVSRSGDQCAGDRLRIFFSLGPKVTKACQSSSQHLD